MTTIEIVTVAWPIVTAVASVANRLLALRFPRLAAFLRAAGLDLPGAVQALRPAPKAPKGGGKG